MKRKCPRCGKIRSGKFGISGLDNKPICGLCASREALKAAVEKGTMTPEDAEKIMCCVQEIYE